MTWIILVCLAVVVLVGTDWLLAGAKEEEPLASEAGVFGGFGGLALTACLILAIFTVLYLRYGK